MTFDSEEDVPTAPTSAPASTARLVLRWFAMLCVPVIAVATWSLVSALRAPSNLSTSEKAVEWLRGHHYGDTVSQVEGWYYSQNQPATGGTLTSLPVGISNGAANSTPPTTHATTATASHTTTSHTTTTHTTSTVHATTTTTAGIQPLVANPLPGEGVWQPYGDFVGGRPAMQVTYLRPDTIHGSLLAAVVRIDQTVASLRLVPGTIEPGGSWPASTQLGDRTRSSLLAAFNSGFRKADSRGGFALNGQVSGDIRTGAATAAIATDGTLTVGMWGRDITAANHPVAIRQNLDLIVDGGRLVDGLDSNAGNRWGRTVGNALYVWRSGVGVDAQGRLIYVASKGLTVKTLAALLQRAGAVRAMELDINYSWVTFNSFHHNPDGSLTGTKLLSNMKKSANRYLQPDARDYFAVVARSPLGS
jgi:hypothetical protein